MRPDDAPPARASPAAGGAGEAAWREISVAPLDGLTAEELDRLLATLSARTGLACRPADVGPLAPLAPVPGRAQIDADRLLFRLEAIAVERGTTPLVGVTGRDIGLALFTFVFGRARVGGHAALVSTARLRPEHYGLPEDPALVARRTAGEVLHELGHLAGRVHCERPDCVMRFAASVEAADLRGDRFCPDCAQGLPSGFARSGADGGRGRELAARPLNSAT